MQASGVEAAFRMPSPRRLCMLYSMNTHILYLHGFLSSPASEKAMMLAGHMADRGLGHLFHAPLLPSEPLAAMLAIEAEIIDFEFEPFIMVGSSLGGYLAQIMAEKWNARAVLVNPAAYPYRHADEYVGIHTHHHTGEQVVVRREYFDILRQAEPARVTPSRYWLLTCTGDEVLDYRDGVERFAGCRQTLLDGGDHSFPQFGDYLDQILAFAAEEG
ncbi:hypothetical protein DFO50_101582 [Microvirgula sp. AG722]|nr:hypothetical protein DFO50_101582 [Microvirgula sp. AG722]